MSGEWDTTGDVVPLHPTADMWVNDAGLVDARPINWVATTIALSG